MVPRERPQTLPTWVTPVQTRMLAGFGVVLLLVLAAVWYLQPGRDVVASGSSEPLRSPADQVFLNPRLPRPAPVEVVLPGGSVQVWTSVDLESIDGAHRDGTGEDEPERLHAPRGAVLRAVSWTVRRSVAISWNPYTGEVERALRPVTGDLLELGEPTLSVTDDAGTVVAGPFDLTASEDTTSVAVALADPDAVGVAIEFDGHIQTADLLDGEVDADRAAPLYAEGRIASLATSREPIGPWRADGSRSVPPRDDLGARGFLHLARGPWLPDRGWVEDPGTEWVLAAAEIYFVRSTVRPGSLPEPRSVLFEGLALHGVTVVDEADGTAYVNRSDGRRVAATSRPVVGVLDVDTTDLAASVELDLRWERSPRPLPDGAVELVADVAAP